MSTAPVTVGSLLADFSSLLGDVRALVQQTTESVKQIGDAAQSMSASVAQIQTDVNGVAQYIQQHGIVNVHAL